MKKYDVLKKYLNAGPYKERPIVVYDATDVDEYIGKLHEMIDGIKDDLLGIQSGNAAMIDLKPMIEQIELEQESRQIL